MKLKSLPLPDNREQAMQILNNNLIYDWYALFSRLQIEVHIT